MEKKMEKILLCTPKFHGYEEIIINYLRIKGFKVDFFDYTHKKYKEARKIKNPFLSLWNNVYLRKRNKNLKDRYEMEAINKDLLSLEEKYDYVIKIGLFFLNESILKILRKKGKYLILYHWDVITINYENLFLKEKIYFDKIASYSKKDAEKYNIKYLPSFYFMKDMISNKIDNEVFTIMSDFQRKEILERIANNLKQKNIKYEIILIDKKLQSSLITIQPESLTLEEIIKKYNKSKVILELVRERNYGCSTLRALDCIGLKKKLITNNKKIINEDYYNKNNILVIDENNIDIPIKFINSPYQELSKEITEKYYIENWLNELLKI